MAVDVNGNPVPDPQIPQGGLPDPRPGGTQTTPTQPINPTPAPTVPATPPPQTGGQGQGQGKKPGGGTYGAGGMQGGNTWGGFNPEGGYWGFNPRNIVGISGPEQQALWQSMNLGNVGAGAYGDAMSGFAGLQSGQLNPLMQQAIQAAGGMGNMNPWMQQMLSQSQGLKDLPPEAQQAMDLYRQARGVGSQQVTGAGMSKDPGFQAAIQAYERTIMPRIQNQAALAGLGNSTALTNAMGSAQAQYMMPTIQDFMGRQERGIDRELQGLMGGAGGLMQGAGMSRQGELARLGMLGQAGQQAFQGDLANLNTLGQAGAMSNANQLAGTQGMFAMGNQQQQNALNAINAMMGTGGTARGISQNQQDAQYNEWIRQMTGFENSMFSPLGMTPGFMGARTIQDKGKK